MDKQLSAYPHSIPLFCISLVLCCECKKYKLYIVHANNGAEGD